MTRLDKPNEWLLRVVGIHHSAAAKHPRASSTLSTGWAFRCYAKVCFIKPLTATGCRQQIICHGHVIQDAALLHQKAVSHGCLRQRKILLKHSLAVSDSFYQGRYLNL